MHQTLAGGPASSSFGRKRVRLDGVSRSYDPRICAIRPDLADVALAELCFAPHYVAPIARACSAPGAMLRGKPDAAASAVTELLHGETFHMLDARGSWAWGYCGHDHYVGYIPLAALGDVQATTHITSAAAPLFTAADIKAPVTALLPPAAQLSGTVEGSFLATADGFVHIRHLRAVDAHETDWIAVAQRYLGAPYVWGGRGFGVDCSGLVQMALAACGIAAPRDTDQQAAAIGTALALDTPLRRGDIIFFPGHVGLMVDGGRMIHANAHWMAVTIEPLADVVARLRAEHEQPITAIRRIET
ncbi:MAG TPA: NlpC/P60 family protein [Sphingobium sp.]|nr:NlpC/P60 family protein [Sphingobium sp.]